MYNSRRIVLVLLFCGISFSLFSNNVEAAAYTVSPIGNDSFDGTPSTPWKTIQKAANTVSAGDTVTVLAGTYSERVSITRSGTSIDPIVFDASGEVLTRGFNISGNYITLDGFTASSVSCDGSDSIGIYVTGDYNVIQNNYAYNNPLDGIYADDSASHCIIRNNRANRNVMSGITVSGSDNLVESNEVWGSIQNHELNCTSSADADGIRFFGTNQILRYNYVHDIQYQDPYVIDAHIDCFQTWSDTYHPRAENAVIEKNFCNNQVLGPYGDHGTGVMIANSVNVTIRNNILKAYTGVNEGGTGINQGMKIVNNTLVGSLTFTDVYYPMGVVVGSTDDIIKNNIFYNFKSHIIWTTQNSANYTNNIAYRSDGVSPQLSYCDPGCTITDPLFVDPANSDFALQSSSPAINAGATLAYVTDDYDDIARPQGAAFDIGAFEYMAGVSSSTSTSSTSSAVSSISSSTTSSSQTFCKSDYNQSGLVDLVDFVVFAANYRVTGIDCGLDLTGDDCFLGIADFVQFAQVYGVPNACAE